MDIRSSARIFHLSNMNTTTKYLLGYGVLTTVLLSYTINDARSNSNNYFTFLFKLTDGTNLGIVLNSILFLFIVLGFLLQYMLFGELRIIEHQHIVERFTAIIISLCLNLTMKDNNIMLNFFLIGISVLSKILHSILVDRLEFYNIQLLNRSGSHLTTQEILSIHGKCKGYYLNIGFIIVDFYIAKFLVYDVFQGVNSVTCLLFGFQFALQGLDCLTILAKNLLNIYEQVAYPDGAEDDDEFDSDGEVDIQDSGNFATEQGDHLDSDPEGSYDDTDKTWESKAIFVKCIEIITALLQTISYLMFIYLLIYHSGISLPFSMLHGSSQAIYQVFQEFKKLRLIMESTTKLNDQVPDATEQDLANGDDTCTICRDTMITARQYELKYHKKLSSKRRIKKLPCGHMVHLSCFKPWFEKHGNCTMCRKVVFPELALGTRNEMANQGNNLRDPANNGPNTNIHQPNNIPNSTTNPENDQVNTLDVPHPSNQVRFPENPVNANNNQVNTEFRVPRSEPATGNAYSEGATNNGYQQIYLPSNAIIPPNWTILPLEESINGTGYVIRLNNHETAELNVRERRPGGDLNLIDPSFRANSRTQI